MKTNPKAPTDRLAGASSMRQPKPNQGKIVRASAERYLKFFEASPAATIVSNSAGKIVYANGQSHRLLGYAREELIGMNIEQLVPDGVRDTHARSRGVYNRRPAERPMTGRNLMARRKDGSLFPVEIGLVPLRLEEGLLILASIVDRTERRQIEEEAYQRANEVALLYRLSQALAGSEDLYYALRAFVSELKQVMIVDAFHIGLYDAETDLLSYPLFLDADRDAPPPPRTLSKEPGLTWEVIAGKKTLYIEDVTDPGVQNSHQMIVIGAPVRSYLGIPLLLHDHTVGVMSVQSFQAGAYTQNQIQLLETIAAQVVVTIERTRLFQQLQRELSERKQLIEELENKNTELERFAYTVSHDLKSPLVTISGYLGYLERDAASGNTERFREDTQRIKEAVDKMYALLTELLKLSRIGRLINSPEVVPFGDVVNESLIFVHGNLEARGATVQIQPDLPSVYGDRQRLTEVIQNLIDNASKFMGDQPTPLIEIGQMGEEQGKPIFYVRDNGIGIAPKYHEQIFGLFNKLEIGGEGTGIGLTIVKRIIELHGGRIWVESEVGRGATFRFTLPRPPQAG
ncbi:MAG: PAS domain S-box protein [Anaerolineales bacterium]|nr:PAS domain S-box protein [Anaerolineales bacterium]